MNIEGILGKIESKADILGVAAGLWGEGIENIIANLQALPTRGHLPSFDALTTFLQNPHAKNALMIWIAGYIGQEAGFSHCRAIKNFAEGMLKGVGIAHVLWWSVNSTPAEYIAAHQGSTRSSSGGGNPFDSIYGRS